MPDTKPGRADARGSRHRSSRSRGGGRTRPAHDGMWPQLLSLNRSCRSPSRPPGEDTTRVFFSAVNSVLVFREEIEPPLPPAARLTVLLLFLLLFSSSLSSHYYKPFTFPISYQREPRSTLVPDGAHDNKRRANVEDQERTSPPTEVHVVVASLSRPGQTLGPWLVAGLEPAALSCSGNTCLDEHRPHPQRYERRSLSKKTKGVKIQHPRRRKISTGCPFTKLLEPVSCHERSRTSTHHTQPTTPLQSFQSTPHTAGGWPARVSRTLFPKPNATLTRPRLFLHASRHDTLAEVRRCLAEPIGRFLEPLEELLVVRRASGLRRLDVVDLCLLSSHSAQPGRGRGHRGLFFLGGVWCGVARQMHTNLVSVYRPVFQKHKNKNKIKKQISIFFRNIRRFYTRPATRILNRCMYGLPL